MITSVRALHIYHKILASHSKIFIYLHSERLIGREKIMFYSTSLNKQYVSLQTKNSVLLTYIDSVVKSISPKLVTLNHNSAWTQLITIPILRSNHYCSPPFAVSKFPWPSLENTV